MTSRKRLGVCFLRGQELAAKQEYEYAHEMFAECVRSDPGNLAYVEAMLANLRAKVAGKKKKLRGRLSRPLGRAVHEQDWRLVIKIGIDRLMDNPWQTATLFAMAQACEALHCNEAELAYLKEALDGDPKSVEVNRCCAYSLGRMGQFDQAIACWHRVEKITSGDVQAQKMISQLAEEKMKYPGGIPPSAAKPNRGQPEPDEVDASDDSQEAQQAIQIPGEIQLTPRQKLERAIQQDSADVSNYLSLANWHCEREQFDQAEQILQRALACCAQEDLINRSLERVRRQNAEFQQELFDKEEKQRRKVERRAFRVPWLESLLLLAGMGLVFQMFPAAWNTAIQWARENMRILLFIGNAVLVTVLLIWRKHSQN